MTKKKEICCGTCKFFEMNMRGYCTYPLPKKLPASFAVLNMWIDSGARCECWKPIKKKKHE